MIEIEVLSCHLPKAYQAILETAKDQDWDDIDMEYLTKATQYGREFAWIALQDIYSEGSNISWFMDKQTIPYTIKESGFEEDEDYFFNVRFSDQGDRIDWDGLKSDWLIHPNWLLEHLNDKDLIEQIELLAYKIEPHWENQKENTELAAMKAVLE